MRGLAVLVGIVAVCALLAIPLAHWIEGRHESAQRECAKHGGVLVLANRAESVCIKAKRIPLP